MVAPLRGIDQAANAADRRQRRVRVPGWPHGRPGCASSIASAGDAAGMPVQQFGRPRADAPAGWRRSPRSGIVPVPSRAASSRFATSSRSASRSRRYGSAMRRMRSRRSLIDPLDRCFRRQAAAGSRRRRVSASRYPPRRADRRPAPRARRPPRRCLPRQPAAAPQSARSSPRCMRSAAASNLACSSAGSSASSAVRRTTACRAGPPGRSPIRAPEMCR